MSELVDYLKEALTQMDNEYMVSVHGQALDQSLKAIAHLSNIKAMAEKQQQELYDDYELVANEFELVDAINDLHELIQEDKS